MAKRLRDKMIEEMEIRGLKERTKKIYLDSMKRFLEFYNQPPGRLELKDLKKYQLYLIQEKKYAPNSVNRNMSGIRFFYRHVLGRHWYADSLPRVRVERKIPTILSEEEVAAMIDSVHNVFWKAVVMTLYSSGIRLSELRNLKVHDIDSKRMVIYIRQSKTGRGRQAHLSPLTLKCLRTYWRLFRVNNEVKSEYLFIPNKNSYNGKRNKSLSHTAVGYILERAAHFAGVKKKSTPTLYATP
jgi:integrase/recombinase XerD